MAAKKKLNKSKSASFLPSFPKFKRVQAIVGIAAVAGIGAYYILSSIAGGPNAVPSASNSIVLEYVAAHDHGVNTDSLPEFHSEPAILYGNGLLLCGVGHGKSANTNELTSTTLTSAQIASLLSSVSDTGIFKLPAVNTVDDFAVDSSEESIAVNYLSGAKKTAYFAGPKPAALLKAEEIITAKCASVNKAYDPEGVVVTSRKVDSPSTDLVTIDGSGIDLTSSAEPKAVELHGLQASNAKNKFSNNSKAKISLDGTAVEATLQPILPLADPISYRQSPGTALASSYVPMRMYWFRPSDRALYSNYGEYSTISAQIRGFFSAQIYNKVPSASNNGVVVGQQTTAYYHACQANISCSSDGDMNAYNNILAEMKARGLVTSGWSTNVASQVPSSRGAGWCYGYGGPIGGVRSASTSFGITFGYGSTTGGCDVTNGTLKYWVPSHEYGHTLGLAHTCGEAGSLMDNCSSPAYNAAWTSYFHVNSGQKSDLNINSLGLNNRIQGRVYNGSTGAGIAASIYTCTGLGNITTDANGNFDARLGTKAGFCLRVVSGAPSGYKLTTYENSEHAGATSYEAQVAGYNCYHNTACSSTQQTWDRTIDSGYNFNYTP